MFLRNLSHLIKIKGLPCLGQPFFDHIPIRQWPLLETVSKPANSPDVSGKGFIGPGNPMVFRTSSQCGISERYHDVPEPFRDIQERKSYVRIKMDAHTLPYDFDTFLVRKCGFIDTETY